MIRMILLGLWEIYATVLLIGLIVQFIRWALSLDDEPERKLTNYIAGAFIWPVTMIKECWKLIRK